MELIPELQQKPVHGAGIKPFRLKGETSRFLGLEFHSLPRGTCSNLEKEGLLMKGTYIGGNELSVAPTQV